MDSIADFFWQSNGYFFRKVEEADLPELKKLKNLSWTSTVQTACLNDLDQKRWFEKITSDPKSLYLIIMNDPKISGFNDKDAYELNGAKVCLDEPIGFWGITEIDYINSSCSFSHGIYPVFRGHGYGKNSLKAGIELIFEVFNFNRIETRILETNEREIKSAINAGMQIEGKQRQAVFKMGQYQNCLILSILRNEWIAKENNG